ncbi:hypothetical protein DF268_44115 [Streptomyces sp. V2]|nr:hypothetical protein DF268_44115 [Streptomyces sp. V2]
MSTHLVVAYRACGGAMCAPIDGGSPDVIRKEEIAGRLVPFAWEAEMLRTEDDPGRPGLMG